MELYKGGGERGEVVVVVMVLVLVVGSSRGYGVVVCGCVWWYLSPLGLGSPAFLDVVGGVGSGWWCWK